MRLALIAASALMGLAASTAIVPAAHAEDDPPFTIGSRPAWFLLGGVTAGATVALADRGGFVGGEVSLARVRDGRWLGVYADGYRDFGGENSTYTTAGLEFGGRFVGLDGGAALRFRGGETDAGATVRISASAGVFSVFARYVWLGAEEDGHAIQVGAMLKVPLMAPR